MPFHEIHAFVQINTSCSVLLEELKFASQEVENSYKKGKINLVEDSIKISSITSELTVRVTHWVNHLHRSARCSVATKLGELTNAKCSIMRKTKPH